MQSPPPLVADPVSSSSAPEAQTVIVPAPSPPMTATADTNANTKTNTSSLMDAIVAEIDTAMKRNAVVEKSRASAPLAAISTDREIEHSAIRPAASPPDVMMAFPQERPRAPSAPSVQRAESNDVGKATRTDPVAPLRSSESHTHPVGSATDAGFALAHDAALPAAAALRSRVLSASEGGPGLAKRHLDVTGRPMPIVWGAPEPDEPPLGAVRRFVYLATPLRWVTAALVVLAIGEAVVIGRLLYSRSFTPPADTAVVVESLRPGADVFVDGRLAGVTPLELKVGSRTRSIGVVSHETPTPTDANAEGVPGPKVDAQTADPLPTAAGLQRSGGIRLSSPIELHVLEGERLLGSSGVTPIVTTAGRHEFELVNNAFGYRSRRVVDIKPGQIVALAVTPPNGSVSINASPWAEVWIDGHSVGETPLGNLSVPLGEHEIVFRHPQLGERREKAIVRSDGPTRVIANLQ